MLPLKQRLRITSATDKNGVPMANKTWQDIEKEVEAEMLDRFNSVPKEKRVSLGLEPGSHRQAHENRQWVQVYIQMLVWKDKCRQLHQKAYPVQPVESAGKKKNKKRDKRK